MYFRFRTLRLALMCLTMALLVSQAASAFAADSPALAVPQGTAVQSDAPLKSAPKPEDVKSAPDTPLARVNGSAITRADVARTLKALLAQNKQGQDLPPELLKQAEATTLENLVSAELLYQAGAKLEMKDLDKLVEAKVSQGRSRFPSNAEFEQALKSSEITEKNLVDFTRKDLVITNLIKKEITPEIKITDEAAKKFYDENIDKFKRPESISASHVLIGVESKASPEEKMKAREKAGALLKKIREGGDFAALAKSDSTCPSKDKGGDLGTFGRGQMVAPFEKAAFALKPGEVSDVVETEFGYHIIKVTERKEPETIKFEESKEKIKDYLKGQKTQQAIVDYITVLKGKAKVEMLEK